jgi:hypothetical protein
MSAKTEVSNLLSSSVKLPLICLSKRSEIKSLDRLRINR